MPRIQYPDVPFAAGVPAVLRLPGVLGNTAADNLLRVLSGTVLQALFLSNQWGIFLNGKNVLETDATSDIFGSVSSVFVGGSVVSTDSFRYSKDYRIAGFPIEGGSFAAYNKIEMPADAKFTINMSGTESQRANFLNTLEKLAASTDVYDVVIPERTYISYNIEGFDFSRSQRRNAGMISVDIRLKQIRTVTAAFIQSTSNAKQPSAKPAVSNGKVQGSTNTKLPTILQGKIQ